MVSLAGLGTRTDVTLGGSRADELRAAVERAWSRCLASTDVEPDGEPLAAFLHEVADDPEPNPGALTGVTIESLLQSLTQRVTARKIATQTGRLLMLHAGAVSDPRTGASLVFVAPGGTGKTTLARVLGSELGYLTDETAGIDSEGCIFPYEKPLSIRPTPFEGHKNETSPDELDLKRAHSAPVLGRIVLLNRSDEHEDAATESLTLFEAISAMCPETSALSALPRPLNLMADLLGSLPPVVRLTYSEARQAAPMLAALLERA